MRHLSTLWLAGVNRLRHLLFPPVCLFCQAPLDQDSGCCRDCHAGIHPWPHAHCARCGTPLPDGWEQGPCGRCLHRPPPMQQSEHLFVYGGPVRQAILQWKLQEQDAAVRWLLTVASARIRGIIAPGDLLLPVPMPSGRMRRSGQHHAAALARWLAEISGARWDWQVLRRQGEQPRQSALSGSERRRNLRKAFVVDADHWTAVRDQAKRVWIVDDIQTTGATMYFAARALRRLHMPVGAFSLARTPHGGAYD